METTVRTQAPRSERRPAADGASRAPLAPDLLRKMNAHWRAANYLSVGQIYLYANPLLREPLKLEHVKPRLLGHWGTTPGQNFVYVHLNRIIKEYELNLLPSTPAASRTMTSTCCSPRTSQSISPITATPG
jgi:hypothetical protein